ncbi:MAG: CRISPR-associated helicase Cas3' [Proteobacteria bacterium]|nr:CRISPR-associated helicase Cas3' [Pseudomonadota bacterium]MBU4472098.1 CRISPR-associated helicase Cas3' [Pseudomonadota bacterium]MCG2752903.1 CRISPR-associated helicase Cas3' [Desulfobacteraceae bacterium]
MSYQFNPKKSGWSKTDSEGKQGLSIFEHCRHVGWVALELILQGRTIPHAQIDPQVAAVVAAIHDVGKWSPGFLHMCRSWLEIEGLILVAAREDWEAQKGIRHEKHSQDSIQLLLQNRNFKSSEAVAWAMVAGAHHGKMHTSENYGRGDLNAMINDWHNQRHQIIEAIESEFDYQIPSIMLKKSDPVVPWLMGLTSVADWIGSDEKHFRVDKGWNEQEGKKSARMAVESIGLKKPEIKTNLEFIEIFGFSANDLQRKALSVITEPGIYVIEAPMGVGKTEAALACTYELLQSGQATGLYFALPTQLTSNRIHMRVSAFIENITLNSDKTRLAHANAWLDKNYYQPRPIQTLLNQPDDDATASRDWFASAKRALLANFGVGTIDQALMSVVAVRHFFVRRFALAGKVVIIDEVHSYDHFTGTLIRCLCQELQNLGCTIIILSATLLPDARNDLIGIESKSIKSNSYPLITGRYTDGTPISPQESTSEPRPSVKRIFKNTEQILNDARKAAGLGARILWVCNTVNAAQEVFHGLSQNTGNFKIGLLHSRFPHYIRQRYESYWMEALGKKGLSKKGCILVSTQIVEQSVDIDSDILISELAPMDMLLQRMGRLWRHLKDRPAGTRPVQGPEIWLVEEENTLTDLKQSSSNQLKKILGIKAKVYQPYVLLKTYETLHQFNTICLSDNKGNTDIRTLLRLTYLNHKEDPESWNVLADDMKGTEFAEKQLAMANTRLFAKVALNDEEGKQTRLNEIETLPLIIATHVESDKITLLNGDQILSNPEKFNIHHARSIHQNIIRVHAWPYDNVPGNPAMSFYLKGKHCLALLGANNRLEIGGLKEGVSIEWSESMGVVQTYAKGDDNESCD